MDYKTYCVYYEKVIIPVFENYKKEFDGIIIHPDAKNKIWNKYEFLNEHCKQVYMKHPENLIDRHKVVACYICAILQANVITSQLSLIEGDDTNLLLNERLAFCFGMTMLRSFILDASDRVKEEELKNKIKQSLDVNFSFPICNHGNYKDNFLSQLYFCRIEQNYNILGLAESLYFIELYHLIRNNIPETIFSNINEKD